MKRLVYAILVIVLGMISGCSNAQSVSSKKVLIVYLSRTNNTKAIAEMIHRHGWWYTGSA
jgi:hypothetical protein